VTRPPKYAPVWKTSGTWPGRHMMNIENYESELMVINHVVVSFKVSKIVGVGVLV